MTDKVVLNEEDSNKVARELMRSAIEVNRLGESFDEYREIGKKISDAHDEPHPDYGMISKWEEDLVSVAEGICGDIVSICKWKEEEPLLPDLDIPIP